MEDIELFEKRKKDHIRIALDSSSQVVSESRLDEIQLIHQALPEIDLKNVQVSEDFLGQNVSPLFVSSMTAGHGEGLPLNLSLAQACVERNWLMGVGSQRRQLTDKDARKEWQDIRREVPNVKLLGNIGIAQVIEHSPAQIQDLIESLEAQALFVHTNPLQEAFQPEGTPQFKNGIGALKKLCSELKTPVILKETGCGFSKQTLESLNGIGLHAVDVAGSGGTNWGLVEGARSKPESLFAKAALSFTHWGFDTVTSVLNAQDLHLDYQIWASGGVKNGVDAAKLIALGSHFVGYAKPMMESALISKEAIVEKMQLFEYELKVALFCTGHTCPQNLRQAKSWQWKKS